MSEEDRDKGFRSILPWVEASSLLAFTLIGAIATSAISLYRIDSIEDKVDHLTQTVASIAVIQNDIKSLKSHDEQTQKIFERFSHSVDRLSTTLAKLEGEMNAREYRNGEER